ncbi:MAG: hypothetical protein KBA31_11800 [Alphaproteobacteria bacterium]|nr:hypothetical protein [Alphaproteobacteria bacterium]
MKSTTITALAMALAASAGATDIDWSRIKPIDAPEMKWQSVQQGDGMRGMFAIPESDGVLLWMSCAGKGAITLSYIDATFEPMAPYVVHMKAGPQAISMLAKTGERWEMDDIVELKTPPITDKPFLKHLTKGEPLALFIIGEGRASKSTSAALPASGRALDPFFKSCGL